MPIQYPSARRSDHVDTYKNTQGEVKVADPYRWLEDPDSPESRTWIEAQNELTRSVLDSADGSDQNRARLTELWNFERWSMLRVRGERLFYSYNPGGDPQPKIMVQESLDPSATSRVLIDPNELSEDGTVAINSYSPSPDGSLLAYAINDAGSDWTSFCVRDVASGEDLPDQIKWSKWSSPSWLPDGSGFFYNSYDQPKEGEELRAKQFTPKVRLHLIGQEQADDAVVWHRPDQPQWMPHALVSDDGKWLILHISKSTSPESQVFLKPLDGLAASDPAEAIEFLSGFESEWVPLGNDGTRFYFKTNADAKRGRIVARELNDDGIAGAIEEIVPESVGALDDVTLVGDVFLTVHLEDVQPKLNRTSTSGESLGEIPLPDFGALYLAPDERDVPQRFALFGSFVSPFNPLQIDLAAATVSPWKQAKLAGVNAADYTTEQIWVTSADGTKVPAFFCRASATQANGECPLILYAYGGFNIPVMPAFSARNLVFMESGGAICFVCARGGAELGDEWHEAAMKLRKPNTFADVIATAEHLIEQGWTRKGKIGLHGGSNGGLMVGACMTTRPDLWGACIPEVGVLDMLRFHEFTIGWAWADEYGSSEDPEMLDTLLSYSPLHTLKPETSYPATLVCTGDHDDRVVPAHSFKFAAELQHCQAGDAPALIRIDVRAGHGAGKPLAKQIDAAVDQLAFLKLTLGE